MKFILLGSGKIAELFLEMPEFEAFAAQNLAAVIGTKKLISLVTKKHKKISSLKAFEINEKKRNEADLFYLLRSECIDFIISIQYPWILPDHLLGMASYRVLNLHNAKLPDYRGHNSISHEILNGELEHTSTLHRVVEEVDRGRILATRNILIESSDTAYSLWFRSVESSLKLLKEFIDNVDAFISSEAGRPVAQGGRYYPKDIARMKKYLQLLCLMMWIELHAHFGFLHMNQHIFYTVNENYTFYLINFLIFYRHGF